MAQAIIIHQKINQSDGQDAVFVSPRLDVILHHNDFLEGIIDLQERSHLLLALLLIRQCQRRLDIVSLATLIHHEVNLQLLALPFAVLIYITLLHHAHIHFATTASQLIIQDVFHNVGLLLLTQSKYGISDS